MSGIGDSIGVAGFEYSMFYVSPQRSFSNGRIMIYHKKAMVIKTGKSVSALTAALRVTASLAQLHQTSFESTCLTS